MLEPSIECPCDQSLRDCRFVYSEPPTGETSFDLGGQKYQRCYDRCGLCGHWFGSHQIDLSHLYGGQYVETTYGNRIGATFERIIGLPSRESDNMGRCKRVMDFAHRHFAQSSSRSLLDVGSGLGVFPYVMKEAGWRCTAVDPDPNACLHIAERLGITAINADFLELIDKQLDTYDVVTLNKVLEHVENPCSMLRAALAYTKPTGFIYIEVPDGNSAAQHGQGREEFFIEHHHVFSVSSLALTVERSGFKVVTVDSIVEPSGKFTLACFATPATT